MLSANIEKQKLKDLFILYKPKYFFGPTNILIELTNSREFWTKYGYSLAEFSEKSNVLISPDLKMLLPTSGSTGNPCFVRLSSKNLDANSTAIRKYLDLTRLDRAITTLPFNYSYGISIINTHLSAGGSIFLNERSVLTREFWLNLNKSSASHFAGVPFTYENLRRYKNELIDQSTLRVFTQAGGKLAPEIISEFASKCNRVGKKFYVMYGQTEATARITYLPPEIVAQKPESIGIPIPGGSVELWDENGENVTEINTEGELIYRGDNVSHGYAYSLNDLASGDENFGVLKTGDIAVFDIDGFLYLRGRKNRFAKVFGLRINLIDLESFFLKLGFVVISIDVDGTLCLITLDRELDTTNLRDLAAKYLNIHKSGIEVRWFAFVPRNDSGKIQYRELVQIWKSQF